MNDYRYEIERLMDKVLGPTPIQLSDPSLIWKFSVRPQFGAINFRSGNIHFRNTRSILGVASNELRGTASAIELHLFHACEVDVKLLIITRQLF